MLQTIAIPDRKFVQKRIGCGVKRIHFRAGRIARPATLGEVFGDGGARPGLLGEQPTLCYFCRHTARFSDQCGHLVQVAQGIETRGSSHGGARG